MFVCLCMYVCFYVSERVRYSPGVRCTMGIFPAKALAAAKDTGTKKGD